MYRLNSPLIGPVYIYSKLMWIIFINNFYSFAPNEVFNIYHFQPTLVFVQTTHISIWYLIVYMPIPYTFVLKIKYPSMISARSCNKVGHLFWCTILAHHETNDVIMYIHSVHKRRGNSFQRQYYKMRLKQRSFNWINSMQVNKILFTNVFFPDHYAC